MLRVVAVLTVLAVGLLAASPFLQYPGLPADTDAELHVFRIAELGYSLRAGGLYPRWAPDFYHGYGYPIFNYYAPLAYYVGYALTLGRPELAAAGAKLLTVLAFVVGAGGAALLGRRFGGRAGGVLGALAFSLAPYVQLISPHIRGDLAESVALAGLPWALWGWERLWRRESRGDTLVAVMATAAVFLSHNLTGLTCVILVAGLSLWRWWGTRHRSLMRVVLAGLVFVLLTAFFWLPFLVERSAIQLDVAGEGHYDFRNHFVAARELLAPLRPIDRRATPPDVPMSVGPQIVLVALAGVGVATITARGRRGTVLRDLGFYVLAAGLLAWLVTESSRPVWEAIPGMAFYQFPWRFLGPIAVLLVPPVAALGAGRFRIRGVAVGLPALAALVILVGALPALYPQPWKPGFGPITRQSIIEAELEGRWRGTTSTNDFVPATVDMIPGPHDAVLASYAEPPVDRVNRATLPASADVRVVPDKPWINRFHVTTEEGFTLRLFLFDFPGWHAYVDGDEVPIELARPEGFITLRVPAGTHEVVVRFGATPVRSVAWVLSGLGAVALVVAACAAPLGGASQSVEEPDEAGVRAGAGSRSAVVAVAAVVGLAVLFKVALFDGAGWFTLTSPPGTAQPAQVPQHADLDGEISLLGFDVSATRVKPGDTLEVTPYWMAQQSITRTYQSFVHLVLPEGQIWAQSDHLNPAGFPTNLWPTDRYIRDEHRLALPDDLPPGLYLLSVGLYTFEDNQRLPVRAASCGRRADSLVLCRPIIVRR